ncbi:hypothetical protein BT69DRAFT_1285910 [Atractiella rhizophila]|nr:hypothetical protein BT69DRAFT_1285910 [Atractiella rhizophila]
MQAVLRRTSIFVARNRPFAPSQCLELRPIPLSRPGLNHIRTFSSTPLRLSSTTGEKVEQAAEAVKEEVEDLTTRLRGALKEGMKARDKFKTGVLRSTLGELETLSKKSPTPPTPKFLQKSLITLITRRIEARYKFMASDNPPTDLIEQYEREEEFLVGFLGEEEREIVRKKGEKVKEGMERKKEGK